MNWFDKPDRGFFAWIMRDSVKLAGVSALVVGAFYILACMDCFGLKNEVDNKNRINNFIQDATGLVNISNADNGSHYKTYLSVDVLYAEKPAKSVDSLNAAVISQAFENLSGLEVLLNQTCAVYELYERQRDFDQQNTLTELQRLGCDLCGVGSTKEEVHQNSLQGLTRLVLKAQKFGIGSKSFFKKTKKYYRQYT